MFIAIKKASSESYWYANKIGHQYEVYGVEDEFYKVEINLNVDGNQTKRYVAPILKIDVEEVKWKSYPDTRDAKPWEVKRFIGESEAKLRERSGFNTKQEIQKYEKLNKDEKVTTKKLNEM